MNDLALPHIAAQILNEPLLIQPEKLDHIMTWLAPRLMQGLTLEPNAIIEARNIEYKKNAEYVVADGVALIPCIGSLVHRGAYRMNHSGTTAYQALDRNLTLAMNDPNVKAILLDLDSPGGQVAGCFEFADRLLEMRKEKKIVAVANSLSASACYAIGCAASELVVTKTASVGSIGVVLSHVDQSKMLANAGVAVTHIYAGEAKINGTPYAPLPESVKAELQAEIDEIYNTFTSHVASARDIPQKAVINTQARMYRGENAVKMQLADRVSTYESEFNRLVKETSSSSGAGSRRHSMEVNNMNPNATADGEPNASTPSNITQAALNAAVLKAKEDGVQAERKRILSIMDAATEHGLTENTMTRQLIETGQDSKVAAGLLLATKESIDAHTGINTSHNEGLGAGVARAIPSPTDIYSKRNRGV